MGFGALVAPVLVQGTLTLATAAGSTGKTWRAYLSAAAAAGQPAVNAKDRIGKGPWQNAKGEAFMQSYEPEWGDEADVPRIAHTPAQIRDRFRAFKGLVNFADLPETP